MRLELKISRDFILVLVNRFDKANLNYIITNQKQKNSEVVFI